MNKYFEWKVLTNEGRLIRVPPENNLGYDVYLYGTHPNEETAIECLKEWLAECYCKPPEDLTLVTFYN